MPNTKITTSGYLMVFQIGLLSSAKIDTSLLAYSAKLDKGQQRGVNFGRTK